MSRNFVIVVDSCSDLSKEIREQYGIEYVRMGIVKKLKEGDVELPASLDWDLFTNKELFDWQRNGMQLKTTQVSMEEFKTVFTRLVEEGNDILYVACSTALSGSYNYSLVVKDEILQAHPEAKIICIDTLCSCLGQGSMAVDVAEMKKEGKTLEECAEYLEENKLCYNQIATVEKLDYLKNAGRVKATAAFFGNIFGVKPIIISDAKGQNYAIKKVKGRKNSLIEIVNMLKEVIDNPEGKTVWIAHADCIDDATYLKDLILKEVHPKEVRIEFMGPTIGISTGPGTLGVYVKGKKVTVVGD